jgi:hypothetical protein
MTSAAVTSYGECPETQILLVLLVSYMQMKGFVNISDKTMIVRFEVFTAVTTKNCVFWDVTPCDSCKNRRFGRT